MESLIKIAAALALLGGVALFYGGRQVWAAAGASAEPETITLADLIARGPAGNPHVRVTDFRFCKDYVQIKGKDDFLGGKAYIPLVPGAGHDPGEIVKDVPSFGAVVKTYMTGLSMVDAPLAKRTEITGMVINRIESLDKDERELSQRQYPETDFDRVLIIDKGRTPQDAREGLIFVGLGVALFLPLVLGVAFAYWRDRRGRLGRDKVTR